MSIKANISRIYARMVFDKIRKQSHNAEYFQHEVFESLMSNGSKTQFGAEHKFNAVRTVREFQDAVPVRTYEDMTSYIDLVKSGKKDVLWPGLPMYFCKTSGTTAGTKYIPLTKDSLPNHIGSARNALLSYIAETGNADFVSGKMIFLQGSPKLDKLPSGIPYGRLSGIVANHVPGYLQKNRMPSFATNCIEDWETKVRRVAEETSSENMTLISGIPSWVLMYFEILLEQTAKKNIKEIFPNFNLFVFGGVNFEPYRKKFEDIIGRNVPTIELYPASEGFIAYQDSRDSEGLLLNFNSGIFFEFIPADQFFTENPPRLTLGEVKIGVNYAIILSSNAGLWGYNIGDTVKFVSLDPPRIIVTGRIKHFTSAFGEHVIAEEVEKAMSEACNSLNIQVAEFHVAPMVNPTEGLPYHEWFIEMDHAGIDKTLMRDAIDNKMQEQNVYYRDLIKGRVLQPAVLTFVRKGLFNDYMKSIGKLGGQNKLPRLCNDRKLADELMRLEKMR